MGVGERGVCTLLGPEGPDVLSESSGPLVVSPCGGLREGYRPYFENYTVDASIFGPILRGWFMKMILKIISQFFDDSNSM